MKHAEKPGEGKQHQISQMIKRSQNLFDPLEMALVNRLNIFIQSGIGLLNNRILGTAGAIQFYHLLKGQQIVAGFHLHANLSFDDVVHQLMKITYFPLFLPELFKEVFEGNSVYEQVKHLFGHKRFEATGFKTHQSGLFMPYNMAQPGQLVVEHHLLNGFSAEYLFNQQDNITEGRHPADFLPQSHLYLFLRSVQPVQLMLFGGIIPQAGMNLLEKLPALLFRQRAGEFFHNPVFLFHRLPLSIVVAKGGI